MPLQQMTILFVMGSNGEQIGGMEKQLSLQIGALTLIGKYKIIVVANSAYRHLFDVQNCTFEALNTRLSRHHPSLICSLYKLVRLYQPDIIHAHGSKAAHLAKTQRGIAALAGKRNGSRFKLFSTIHGTKSNLKLYESFDTVFAVSQSIANSLKPKKAHVLWNAIEPYQGERLSKVQFCANLQLDPKLPLLMAIGRLAPVKNYSILMKACKDLPVNLIIMGDGTEYASLAPLQTDAIKLMGHVSVPQANLAAADALVVSSIREGLSMSMLEALELEIPVLSSAISGAKDLLPDKCLLNIGSAEALKESLAAQINRLEEIKQDLKPVFLKVQQEFSPESIVDTLIKHYDSAH